MSNGERVSKPNGDGGTTATKERAAVAEASNLLGAASDVLQHQRATMIEALPATDRAALWMLLAASTGQRDGKSMTGEDRRALLTAARARLDQAMKLYAQDDDQKEWLQDNVQSQLDRLERFVSYDEADDRVRGAVMLPGNKVVDPSDDAHPHEQANALHDSIPKLVAALKMVDEAVVGLHEDSIKEAVNAFLKGENVAGVRVGSFVELGNLLGAVNGWLVLSDDELRQKLREIDGVLSGVQTIGELVKATLQLVAGTMGIVSSSIGLIARALREPELAQLCSSFSQSAGLKVGKVLTGIEILTSVATLLNGRASRQQRVDAGVGLATSSASYFAKAETELGGVSVLPAAAAAQLGYAELKLTLDLYWGAAEGLVSGLMGPAFATLAERGRMIAAFSDRLLKAQALVSSEQDPHKKQALQEVVAYNAGETGTEIDALIADVAAPDLEAGMARSPGAYQILVDAMRPVFPFRGVRSTEGTMIAASVALSRLAWVSCHRAQIVGAAASHRGLDSVKDPKPQIGVGNAEG